MGSSNTFVLSFSGLFSHSNAIRTIPMLISLCNTVVCMASSTTNVGRVLGFSCMERLTRPFRYPNNVPVIREPALFLPSGILPPGRVGNLHAGDMMGNDRKTDRKTRRTFGLFFFLVDGWRRDNGGAGGGGFDEVDDWELVLTLGSPITGPSQPAMEKFHEREEKEKEMEREWGGTEDGGERLGLVVKSSGWSEVCGQVFVELIFRC